MSKSLVSLRHFMRIFLLFEGCTGIIIRIKEFRRKTVSHSLSGTGAGGGNNPPHSQGFAPYIPNFNRNLISRAAYAPGLNFDYRFYIIQRF